MNPVRVRFCTAIVCAGLAFGLAARAEPYTPTFRDFSGACQGKLDSTLWDSALSWDRHDLSWAEIQPEPGTWNQDKLEAWGQRVLDCRSRGVRVLPMLGYNAPWSWDHGPRTVDVDGKRIHITPEQRGRFTRAVYVRGEEGRWRTEKVETVRGSGTWPLAEEHVAAWCEYVRRVTAYLVKPPYNVTHFQIWNEAHPASGFWDGNLDTYMERVHLPAARIIHELGGKVVYGGFPSCGSRGELVALLDRHRAWDSIDVIDVHYNGLDAWPHLAKAAAERGRRDLGIWQTEIGFTANPGFVGNVYPRIVHWCLENGWDDPNRYRAFLFAYWSPADSKAYGYGKTLLNGDRLSVHGESLATLGELLQGDRLRPFDGISSSPPLSPVLKETESSMEAFAVDDRIVVAVHWVRKGRTRKHDPRVIAMAFEGLDRKRVTRVERWTANGDSDDITRRARTGWRRIEVDVPLVERSDVVAPEWWGMPDGSIRTFYVVLDLGEGGRRPSWRR